MADRRTNAEKEAARAARREAALALRASLSPTGAAGDDRLRIATWNLNSLKPRLPAVDRFLERARPDVLCLQETKAASLTDAALEVFARHGFEAVHAGTNSYNGVAIVTRHPMSDVVASGGFADEHLDREPRVISAVVRVSGVAVRVVSVYVPHGRTVDHWHYEYKLAFFDALAARTSAWLADAATDHVAVVGDINVAATDSDVFHPDAFVGSTHVTPKEREALGRLLDAGIVDVEVARHGARARRFTWWNHGIGYSRNLGMRLDVVATDVGLARRLDATWIDHVERGSERPSDHAALIADFDLGDRVQPNG